MLKSIKIFMVIPIIIVLLTLSSCKREEVFRDYTATESYNSSAEIADTTDLAEILMSAEGVSLVDYKPMVSPGESTSITIKAEDKTEYRIEVEYSSGISKSKALTPKVSDQNGYVTWNWQIGSKCHSGKFPVRIYKGTNLIFETRIVIK